MPTLPTLTHGEAATLLRQMEQFFEATTDAVIFLDRNDCFTFLNRRAQEIISTGLDLTGRNFFEVFPGNGTGLWVSQEIVHRHRGSLSVRSSQFPRHHGTVFTLFLPFDAVIR